MWKRSGRACQLPTQQQVLSEIEQEQLEIAKIQKQRDIILKLQDSFLKKDQQLERLTALVDKYKPYFEHCSAVRLELAQRDSTVKSLTKENQLLRREFEQLLSQCEELTGRLKSVQMEKQALLRERHSIERVNRDIQQTFKEYQSICRRREQQLLRQLDETNRQSQSFQNTLEELKNNHQQFPVSSEQIQQLQLELAEKDKELQKAKILSQELSEQYDKSVNKICEFERELNQYRVQNHELRKTLGLVLQQDKYQKLQEKYLKKGGDHDEIQGSSQEEDESQIAGESSPQLSDLKF